MMGVLNSCEKCGGEARSVKGKEYPSCWAVKCQECGHTIEPENGLDFFGAFDRWNKEANQ